MRLDIKDLRVPTFKESLVIAAVAVIVGFLLIHPYRISAGIMGNAMNGTVIITDDCPQTFYDYSTQTFTKPPQPFLCGLDFPYRWLLISVVLLVAGCWYWETTSKKS